MTSTPIDSRADTRTDSRADGRTDSRADGRAEHGEQPLLAVVYTPDSFSIFQLVDASRDCCRLLWVVDSSEQDIAGSLKMMARFGKVVDIAGLTIDRITEAVAAAEPQGVVTFTDSGQLLAAQLGGRLGLEFHDVEVVERLIDKVAQRTALRAAGFPTPDFWSIPGCAPASVIDDVVASVSFPVVVKPSQGSASRDAYRADSVEVLQEVLQEHREEDMIVESFLSDLTPPSKQELADFVSVESVVLGDQVHHLAVTGRFPLAAPFRGSGMFIPSNLTPELDAEVRQLAGDAAIALGVRSGFTHTEIKITPDGPRIIEVNGRVGGGVPDIVRLLGGPPFISWRMRLALGLPVPLQDVKAFERIGFFLWHQPPIGAYEVTAVHGLEDVAQLPGVEEVRLARRVGDPVDWHEGGVGHVFGVGGVVDDYDELIATRHRILETTSVEYRWSADVVACEGGTAQDRSLV